MVGFVDGVLMGNVMGTATVVGAMQEDNDDNDDESVPSDGN